MAKKLIAVLLSVMMVVCTVPFSTFALDEVAPANYTAQERVDGWNENMEIVLEKLFDNESSSHWAYVAENNDALAKKMLTYTVFALYDDAWKNGIDKSITKDKAKDILVALIDKVDTGIGNSIVEKIVKVLDTATDISDVIQKVDGYAVKISDFLKNEKISNAVDKVDSVVDGETWNDVIKYMGYAIKAGNLYLEARERVITAYAKILAVQAANAYYIDMLGYIAENCEYEAVRDAANDFIEEIQMSVGEIFHEEALKAVGYTASTVLQEAARVAMNSNTYTAVALKVYDKATDIADVLWNTDDQYALMDELYTTFFIETAAVDWAKEAMAQDKNADLEEFSVSAVLGLRKIGAQSLYDLKLAQNEGIIGRVKNQINYNISFKNAAELQFLNLAEQVLFNTDVGYYVKIDSIFTAATSAFVNIDGVYLTNACASYEYDNGYYSVVYCDGIEEFIKTAFIIDDQRIDVLNDSEVLCTATLEKIRDNKLTECSFTDLNVGGKTVIKIDTSRENGTYTARVDNVDCVKSFNTEFVYPEYTEITAKTVANACVEIVKDEAKGKVISIKEYIDRIFAMFKNVIGRLLKGEWSAIKDIKF